MIDYIFTYKDSRSKSVVVKHYSLASDAEACEMASLTYEFFGVQVTRGSVLVATNPSNVTGGVYPKPGIVLT